MEISCVFYDFDGVMTDNRVLIDPDGKESVFVNRSDGYAVARFRELGIPQLIVSTEENSIVEKRAKKLKIPVLHGIENKGECIKEYAIKNNIDLASAVFMGNDLNDISAFEAVGIKCAPVDAEKEVLKLVDWVSTKRGGNGAVRDLYRAYIDGELKSAIEGNWMNSAYASKIEPGTVWAIIPAREGSKGVINKNIRPLGGHPLIAHTIAVCNLSGEIQRTVVTTDSEKYAEIAKIYGAEIPFLRPVEYATDSSQDIEFMKHAIMWFAVNEGRLPEYWVHMRTTCPIRRATIVDEAVKKIKLYSEATSLLSVCTPKGVLSPYKWMIKDGEYLKSIFFENNDDANRPRQTYPNAYSRSIYVDIYKSKTIIENEALFGKCIIPFETDETIDIDVACDLERAEKLEIDDEVINYLEGCVDHGDK